MAACERCRPFNIYDRHGNDDMSEGSGRPAEIVLLYQLMAARRANSVWSRKHKVSHAFVKYNTGTLKPALE